MKNDRFFNGTWFLEFVTEKLKHCLAQVERSLRKGKEEIASMHEYYWENYAEMDQYGYEDYDNQQALLHQVNANQEIIQKRRRYQKMLESPFFGRVDFRFEGEDEIEPLYIGIGNFDEGNGEPPLIYDWRAPVSSLFYDYDKGLVSYEAPAGTVRGEICAKWQYKIRNGEMLYGFESDTKIDDEILKQELGNNGDVQLKNIVRTIQKEQNQIIRNTKDEILVIQGAAGSGKTSIALHRIAYLLYHDRKNLASSNVLILSPNGVFADYISHILPELGEERIQEMSFDLFAYHELQDVAADCQDKYDYLERRMKYPNLEDKERFDHKQSAAFVGEMEGFLAVLEDQLMDFHEITFKGMKLTEEELIRMFYSRFQETPLLERALAVMEHFADAYETLHQRDLSEEEWEYLEKKFSSLYVSADLYEIYNWLLEETGFPQLPDLPLEKRQLPYEDVYPMLYLKYRLKRKASHKRIKHLVIDEMQDYSYLQYVIIQNLFSCRMTILGDKAQTLDDTPCDATAFLQGIFGKKMRKIELLKSYRNTVEIARYAQKISKEENLDLLERHGKAVEEQQFSSEDALLKAIRERLSLAEDKERDGDKKRYETAAVLTLTQEEAYDLYRLLKQEGIQVSYVDRDSSVFQKGLTVTTFYLAKGLEFDQVFALCWDKRNPLWKQAQYICATRALHELYVYGIEENNR